MNILIMLKKVELMFLKGQGYTYFSNFGMDYFIKYDEETDLYKVYLIKFNKANNTETKQFCFYCQAPIDL